LQSIKPFKTCWRVQVKIVHSWKQFTLYAGETLEMVLADVSGTLIHATIKKQQLGKFQRLIVTGEWRIFENFVLTKAMGRFRVTKHVYRMSVMNITSIVPCASLSSDIYLDLIDFGKIHNDESLNENIFIDNSKQFILNLFNIFQVDVLGQVVNVGEMKIHIEKKKLEFELRDTNDIRLACTLWGTFAEKLLAAIEQDRERSISNGFDASLLEIDPYLPAVHDFKENLPKDGLALTINLQVPKVRKSKEKGDEYKGNPTITIAELLQSYEEGKFRVLATICAIDIEFAWYYFVC
ncbi:hypothetical protein CARUB_v10011294mg, partial [Capsella rubella]